MRLRLPIPAYRAAPRASVRRSTLRLWAEQAARGGMRPICSALAEQGLTANRQQDANARRRIAAWLPTVTQLDGEALQGCQTPGVVGRGLVPRRPVAPRAGTRGVTLSPPHV